MAQGYNSKIPSKKVEELLNILGSVFLLFIKRIYIVYFGSNLFFIYISLNATDKENFISNLLSFSNVLTVFILLSRQTSVETALGDYCRSRFRPSLNLKRFEKGTSVLAEL